MDPDAANHFHVKSATCNACAALERQNDKRGDRPAPPGRREYVVPDAALVHAMTYPIHVPPFAT